jgi:hypothetical protein
MKRVTLMLDEALLEEASRVFSTKTCSATVTAALTEVLRVRKVELLASFFGEKLWHGNLSRMRGDHTLSGIRKRPKLQTQELTFSSAAAAEGGGSTECKSKAACTGVSQ